MSLAVAMILIGKLYDLGMKIKLKNILFGVNIALLSLSYCSLKSKEFNQIELVFELVNSVRNPNANSGYVQLKLGDFKFGNAMKLDLRRKFYSEPNLGIVDTIKFAMEPQMILFGSNFNLQILKEYQYRDNSKFYRLKKGCTGAYTLSPIFELINGEYAVLIESLSSGEGNMIYFNISQKGFVINRIENIYID